MSHVVGTVKIRNLNVTRVREKHIAGFNVQVYYAKCVNILQIADNFTAAGSGVLHAKNKVKTHDIRQINSTAFDEDQDQFSRLKKQKNESFQEEELGFPHGPIMAQFNGSIV